MNARFVVWICLRHGMCVSWQEREEERVRARERAIPCLNLYRKVGQIRTRDRHRCVSLREWEKACAQERVKERAGKFIEMVYRSMGFLA